MKNKTMSPESISAQQRTCLEDLLDVAPPPRPESRPVSATLTGRVEDTHNPDLPGRVLVRWKSDRGDALANWLTYIVGCAPRRGDAVLMVRPGNDPQWVVSGVLSRATPEPTTDSADQPETQPETLRLQPGQRVRIEAHDGTALIEIDGAAGEVSLRLLGRNVALEAAGRLRLVGSSVEIEGGIGGVDIRTEHEVVVRGRQIRLN